MHPMILRGGFTTLKCLRSYQIRKEYCLKLPDSKRLITKACIICIQCHILLKQIIVGYIRQFVIKPLFGFLFGTLMEY
jgi:hypothetical protein